MFILNVHAIYRLVCVCFYFLIFFFYVLSLNAQKLTSKDELPSPKDTSTSSLSEVVVYATRKSIITQDARKISFKPSEELKTGNSVTDLFRSTPFLSYKEVGADGEPEVNIIGKSSTTIFINGKPTYLTKDAIMNMLASKNAQEIERIEVIANPKPSPDIPQGGGVINIVLKDNLLKGWSGDFLLDNRQNSVNGGGLGTNITYKYNKFKANVSAIVATRGRIGTLDNTRLFNSSHITQNSTSLNKNRVIIMSGARTNYIFHFNKQHDFSFGVDGFFLKKRNQLLNSNAFFKQDASASPFDRYQVDNRADRFFYAVGVHTDYEYKPDTLGSYFQAKAMLYHLNNDLLTTLVTENTHTTTQSDQVIRQATPFTTLFFRFLFSYNHVFNEKHSMEGGISYMNIRTQNSFNFLEKQEDIFVRDHQRSTLFNYTTPTYMGYVSYNGNWTKRLQTMVNLSVQYYQQYGLFQNNGNVATHLFSYWFFLPNISLSYNFSKQHLLTLSFLRNSEPPSFRDVNPFRVQQGNNTYTQGNENLQVPAYYEVGTIYTLKQRYIFAIKYTLKQRAFTTVQFVDPDDPTAIISMPFNYGNQQGAFLSFSSSNTFFKSYWQMQTNLSGQYIFFKGDIPSFKINRGGFGGNMNWTNTIFLMPPHKKNKWLATLDFEYNFPSFFIYGFQSTGPNLSLGVKKNYNDWTFVLSFTDVLRTSKLYSTFFINQLVVKTVEYQDMRAIKFKVSFRFDTAKGKGSNKGLNKNGRINKESSPNNFEPDIDT